MPTRIYVYMILPETKVFPIAIYLTSGRGGLVRERYIEHTFDDDITTFVFHAIGLPGLRADDYLGLDNPLAPAVSALMQPSRLGKVAQKFQSLLTLVRSGVDEARLTLLKNVVEKYLTLDDAERARFEALVATPEGKEVAMVVSVYEERGIEKGMAQGLAQGIEQGIAQGIEQGIKQGLLRGECKTLLRQIERKFGPVSDEVRNRLERITDVEELDRLADHILTAQSIEEMGL